MRSALIAIVDGFSQRRREDTLDEEGDSWKALLFEPAILRRSLLICTVRRRRIPYATCPNPRLLGPQLGMVSLTALAMTLLARRINLGWPWTLTCGSHETSIERCIVLFNLLLAWTVTSIPAYLLALLRKSRVLGAFSGLFAGVITEHLKTARGKEGWRWLFLIEGVDSCFVALFTSVILPDWPVTTKWLTPEERVRLQTGKMVEDVLPGRRPSAGSCAEKRQSRKSCVEA
ncbi:hypothetical protein BDZ89DRAFT_1142618 [Hymenopellis radicata]|nr:hypothetical protein BDZ89DRAFT_1142618 [Hymenopellis radicata]